VVFSAARYIYTIPGFLAASGISGIPFFHTLFFLHSVLHTAMAAKKPISY